jgi:hypothetical protein
MVWAILGQAAGAYVGPTCWAVLFLMGAAAILHQRSEAEKVRSHRGSMAYTLETRLQTLRARPAVDAPQHLTHKQ